MKQIKEEFKLSEEEIDLEDLYFEEARERYYERKGDEE